MVRRRRGSIFRSRRAGALRATGESILRRRPRRKESMRFIKKAALGTAAGLAVAVPMSFIARSTNNPILFEVGERAGAVAASYFGGSAGQVGFQLLDAGVERMLPRLTAGNVRGIGAIGGGV